MELRQFLAFKEVVERGGFTRAANHLHLTQSAVSQQVKALEDELGTALLHRVCRQVRLTDAGQVFLSHAKQILEQVEDAQSDVAEVVGGVKGSCRIACIPSIAPRILPHLILAFRQTFPGLEIQTSVGSESQLLSWLKEGSVDVCMTGLPIACEEVEQNIVMQEKFVIAVPVEHHFAGRKTIKLEELFSEDLIMFPHESLISSWFTSTCQDVGFKPNIVFESTDLNTRMGMVAAGLGISVESQYLISCSAFKGSVMVEVEQPELVRDIGVIWRQSGHRPRNVDNFLSMLDQVLQQPDFVAMRTDAYCQENESLVENQPADEMALI
jgi:LysR family transcriptional activator of glutamate synthase operon